MSQLNYGIVPDPQLVTLMQSAMKHAADGLSDMVGRLITIDVPHIETLSMGQMSQMAENLETETVGVYLLVDGDFTGQVLLMLPIAEALYMVDLLLGQESGTTAGLGDLERSALAEAGNLVTSYFLNEIAALTQISARPSPPAVMVDMMGAIVDVVVTPIASVTDALFMAETTFQESGRAVLAYFWVLPQPIEIGE